MSTTTFGAMPSSSPFSMRQMMCWVWSPPMPKLAGWY
jgi:hypothetical protein